MIEQLFFVVSLEPAKHEEVCELEPVPRGAWNEANAARNLLKCFIKEQFLGIWSLHFLFDFGLFTPYPTDILQCFND